MLESIIYKYVKTWQSCNLENYFSTYFACLKKARGVNNIFHSRKKKQAMWTDWTQRHAKLLNSETSLIRSSGSILLTRSAHTRLKHFWESVKKRLDQLNKKSKNYFYSTIRSFSSLFYSIFTHENKSNITPREFDECVWSQTRWKWAK